MTPSEAGWKKGISINESLKKKYNWQPKGLLGAKEL